MGKIGITILGFVFVFTACRFDKTDKREDVEQNISEADLINMHKSMMHAEDILITKFLAEQPEKYIVTGTGLRYFVLNKTNGKQVQESSNVTLKYAKRVLLRDSSNNNFTTINFVVGHSSQIPTGIDEGIRLMKVGEKARFILPPHLGYGVSGEQSLGIPPKAILIYDIEIIEVAG